MATAPRLPRPPLAGADDRAGRSTSSTGSPPRWSCCSTSASWWRSPRSPPSWRTASPTTTSAHSLLGYLMVFFAIWWAWMNFTWFASAYDTDDVPYRLLTLVQMAGVLVLAAGVPRAFDRAATSSPVTIGYVIMRLGHGGAVAAGRAQRPASTGTTAHPVRHRHRGRAGRLGAAAAAAGTSVGLRLLLRCSSSPSSPCRVWAERAADDALAPAPHRRALRAVHDHRARRVRARLERRAAGGGRGHRAGTSTCWSSAVAGWCCCSPCGGCTSSRRPARGSADGAGSSASAGATATTRSSPRWPPSAPGSR